jgi:2-polyprenyl-3-methyl-5-hydroxy-6-metoxy-1,4-benzoquinol methylase
VPLELTEHRKIAAERSGGVSADPIYSAIEHTIMDFDLTGAALDYGSGTGILASRLLSLDRFESVSAVDILPRPDDLPSDVHWIEQDLNLPAPWTELFDLIVAAEVVEHLENPRFTFREMFQSLRPGGTVIVTTPNNESWRSIIALLARGHFVSFGDTCYPAHITALLRKDLQRIAAETGLVSKAFRFTDHGSIPGVPQITWQGISLGLLRGVRFSDNLLFIGQKKL